MAPDAAVFGGQNSRCQILAQSLHRRESGNTWIAKVVYSTCCSSPDHPFPIFREGPNRIAGQSFGASVMLHRASMNTEQTFSIGGDPKVPVFVE